MNTISIGWCATGEEVVKLVEGEQGQHRCNQCGVDLTQDPKTANVNYHFNTRKDKQMNPSEKREALALEINALADAIDNPAYVYVGHQEYCDLESLHMIDGRDNTVAGLKVLCVAKKSHLGVSAEQRSKQVEIGQNTLRNSAE